MAALAHSSHGGDGHAYDRVWSDGLDAWIVESSAPDVGLTIPGWFTQANVSLVYLRLKAAGMLVRVASTHANFARIERPMVPRTLRYAICICRLAQS
jgi:hypothetical protein